MLLLSRSDLSGLVEPADVVTAVEEAFRALADGNAHQPPVRAARVAGADAQFLPMAAVWDGAGLAGTKLLADIPSNRDRGLPAQRSVLVLVDSVTGEPVAVMDGAIPTRLRTAATSAVATRHLARRDWSVLGLVGAGALAVEHLRAHLVDTPVEKVAVWSRTEQRLAAFTAAVAAVAPDVRVSPQPGPREVVAASDVLCTLTPSREPIVAGAWLRPGMHVNVVGAPPRPDHREVDAAAMAAGRLVVDARETALHESGDALLAVADGALRPEDCGLELAGVISGRAAGRRDDDEVTVFNSVGLGIEDVAVGRLLVDAARSRGVGLEARLDR
ncbi:ornithine cyclodeaminase/alanine dehydrogenase [Mumia flava]|uniref:Ornithine cyclodeaminase/alanine dehydrogenase n=1 Tax=Mumia flava TaxID=1348852 RepID=A0A0B2BA15_9ACTN|nr:ornithine cyclodeaminase family protein [Mumia flava]PJJ53702.1 ornithine cyclodeaminase/alanine dehydrogenase [Mumia flava]